MPIDWESVVAPFRDVFRLQNKAFHDTISLLAKWLKDQVEAAQKVELLSQNYPIIDFTDGALQLSIAAFQHRTLAIPSGTSGPRPADEYMSAWQRFLQGFQRIPDAVEEALAIPRLVRVIDEMLATIVASLNRWDKPTAAMFKQPKSFSDVFGEIFMFAEMLAMSVDPIRVILRSDVAKILAKMALGPSKKESSGSFLDTLIQYIASALLLIPTGFLWIIAAVRWADISVRAWILDFLIETENNVYAMRQKALEFIFGPVIDNLRDASDFVTQIKDQVLKVVDNLGYFVSSVAYWWGMEAHRFLRLLTGTLGRLNDFFQHILEALEGILDIDVGEMYTWGLIPFKLRKVVNAVNTHNKAFFWAMKIAALEAAFPLMVYDVSIVGFFRPRHYTARLEALESIFDELKSARTITVPAINLPSPASDFPDISEWLSTKNPVDLRAELTAMRDKLVKELPGMVDTASDALGKISDEAEASAKRALYTPPSDVAKIWDFANTTAAGMFADQKKQLLDSLHQDALAAAFDQAVASGGFHIVGAGIPLYVESMKEVWEDKAKTTDADLPTSPHILAKRQKLGRVDVPSVTIRTAGRIMDDGLISRVAGEFRRIVQGAWTDGLAKVEAGA